MANKTKAQNKGQNQRASEAPVSEEIRRAAERIGIPVDAYIEQERKRRFGEETQLTFSLTELCDAIGFEVHPESFASDAFERIAQQIEGEAHSDQDDENWHRLRSIAERANFAALVVRKLQETAVAS
jgi:hypothetical protein